MPYNNNNNNNMPTGSLCAERNAIGSALAEDLSLHRQDLRMIAVFSPPSLSSTTTAPPATVAEAISSKPGGSVGGETKSTTTSQQEIMLSNAPENFKSVSSTISSDLHQHVTGVLSSDSVDAPPVTPRDVEFQLLSQESMSSSRDEKKKSLGMSPGLSAGAVGHRVRHAHPRLSSPTIVPGHRQWPRL